LLLAVVAAALDTAVVVALVDIDHQLLLYLLRHMELRLAAAALAQQ